MTGGVDGEVTVAIVDDAKMGVDSIEGEEINSRRGTVEH